MAGSVLILEAAARLGVSRRTVYYWIRDGRLVTIRARGGSQRVLLASIDVLLGTVRAGGAESAAPSPAGARSPRIRSTPPGGDSRPMYRRQRAGSPRPVPVSVSGG